MTQPQTAQMQQYYSNLYEKMNYQKGQIDQNQTSNHNQQCLTFDQYISSENVYVDKTLFVHELLESWQKTQIVSIHKPPKFGKSFNVSMVYSFFNCLTNKKQTVLDLHNSKYRFQIFEQKYKESKVKRSSTPVILLKFSKVQAKTSNDAIKGIINQIRNKYEQIKQYIVVSEDNKDDIEYIEQMFQMFLKNDQIPKNSFQILSLIANVISKSFKKQCYLLIDDYSYPFQYLICQKRNNQQIKKLFNYLSHMICACCSVNRKNKILLVGKIDVGLYSLLSYLKIGVREKKFYQYFGFNQNQIRKIINGCKFQQQKFIQELQLWYNGYIIYQGQQHFKHKFLRLYNPYSVMQYRSQCLKQKKVIPGKIYRQQDSNNLVFNFLKKQSFANLQDIISLVQLIKTFNKNQSTEKISILVPYQLQQSLIFQQCFINQKQYSQSHPKTISKFMAYLLLNNGFLTGYYLTHCKSISIFIPNKQVFFVFAEFLRSQLKEKQIILNFSKIPLQNTDVFINQIQKCINNWKYQFPSKNQNNYHSLIYLRIGLSIQAQHKAYTQQQTKNGALKGKIDNVFYPRTAESKKCFIHEYKYVKTLTLSQNQKETIFVNAFYQIFIKGYINWGIKQNKSNYQDFRIDEIITRAIICHHPQSLNVETQFKMYIKQMAFTLNQAKSIKFFFEDKTVQQILIKNKQDYEKLSQQLLQLTNKNGFNEMIELIKQMTQSQMIQYLESRKQLFKRNRQQNFNLVIKLLQINNINKIKFSQITQDIFRFTEQNLIQISYPLLNLSQQQAKQIKKELQKLRKSQSGIFPISFTAGVPKKRKPQ